MKVEEQFNFWTLEGQAFAHPALTASDLWPNEEAVIILAEASVKWSFIHNETVFSLAPSSSFIVLD